jgi:predicted regulator of Ras-like GTPase activity (Roadblock/LC7/MglB family)
MSRADLLARALDQFLAVSPEVEAAAVVSADGLPIASALPEHVEEDRLAAMSAALLILGERAASGLGKGELSQVLVEGRSGYVVLMAAGPHAVLVAVTSVDAKAGLLLFEMRRMADDVAQLMGRAPRAEDRAPVMPSVEDSRDSIAAPAETGSPVTSWQ